MKKKVIWRTLYNISKYCYNKYTFNYWKIISFFCRNFIIDGYKRRLLTIWQSRWAGTPYVYRSTPECQHRTIGPWLLVHRVVQKLLPSRSRSLWLIRLFPVLNSWISVITHDGYYTSNFNWNKNNNFVKTDKMKKNMNLVFLLRIEHFKIIIFKNITYYSRTLLQESWFGKKEFEFFNIFMRENNEI